MSELEKALAAVGESAPERPLSAWMGASAAVNALAGHVKDLESLALRLAVRLERAERCRVCSGSGREWEHVGHDEHGDAIGGFIHCAACSGTGKEQGR